MSALFSKGDYSHCRDLGTESSMCSAHNFPLCIEGKKNLMMEVWNPLCCTRGLLWNPGHSKTPKISYPTTHIFNLILVSILYAIWTEWLKFYSSANFQNATHCSSYYFWFLVIIINEFKPINVQKQLIPIADCCILNLCHDFSNLTQEINAKNRVWC